MSEPLITMHRRAIRLLSRLRMAARFGLEADRVPFTFRRADPESRRLMRNARKRERAVSR